MTRLIIQSFFYDEIRLNKECSAVLKRQLNAGIRKILGISSITTRDQINRPSKEHIHFRNVKSRQINAQRPQHRHQKNRVYQGPRNSFLARDNMDVTILALNDNPVESINNTSTETLSTNFHTMEKMQIHVLIRIPFSTK
jgi:hypothetical protein